MLRFRNWLVLLVCLLVAPTLAHDAPQHGPVVIDTDMGLDDAVALALALQHPRLDIAAIVACEGVASGERAAEHLERMLCTFNRQDVPLYAAAAAGPNPAPPFRSFAEQAVGQALPVMVEPFRRPFSPEAYLVEGEQTTVLALGPLSNLAAALQSRPEIRDRIARIVFVGSPDPAKSWNLSFDPQSLATIQKVGVLVEFITPGDQAGRKPEAWSDGEFEIGLGASLGEQFFNELLSMPRVRQHYTRQFAHFHDELAVLYLDDPSLFWKLGGDGVRVPKSRGSVSKRLARLLGEGRQTKSRVVFVDGTLPDEILRADVLRRKEGIVAKNGETEWFAQLLLNELHQHLGVYSVLGVKMGLHAAELLNAPQHGMKIISHVAARPPMSCTNDGLIIATGCTPGRLLFAHAPADSGHIEATFEYNNRRIRLRLKSSYHDRIQARVRALLAEHTLEDPEYWSGVRAFGLDVWENWRRGDLFEAFEPATP